MPQPLSPAAGSEPGEPAPSSPDDAAPDGLDGPAPLPGADLPARRTRRSRGPVLAGILAVVALAAATAAVVRMGTSDDGVAWRIEDRSAASRLVADDDTVCGTTDDDDLFCLDAADGHELFRRAVGSSVQAWAVVDGVLLATDRAGEGGRMTAYSRDGEEMWTTGIPFVLVPLVADGVVVTPSDAEGTLRALDLTSGEPRWETTLDTSGDDGASAQAGVLRTDGEWLYALVMVRRADVDDEIATQLVALDPASGEERWRTTLATAAPDEVRPIEVQDVAALDDSTTAVIVGETTRDRRLLVVDGDTGDIVEEDRLTDEPAVVAGLDGRAIVLSGPRLQGYTAGGRSAWTATVPGGADSPGDENVRPSGDLLTASGRLYVHTSGVWAVDPRTGDLDPVVEDGVGPVVLTREHVVAAHGCCTERTGIQAHDVPG